VELPQPGIKKFDVVRNFGHGAHGRTGSSDRVLAVNGNGRRDPIDPVHLGTIHAIHKLPCIRRKGFDVTALALGIERIESQRRLAGSADTGHHRDLIQRNLKVEVFEIVLPRPFYLNCLGFHPLSPGNIF
jgi:hypothetical protein